jgi:hypothetical protein
MRNLIVVTFLLFFASCGSQDKKTILGKWHSEDYWFEFHDENKYSGGRGPMINVKKEDYVLEPSEGKLTFYTNQESESYYLIYDFIREDTLVLTNSMNKTSVPAIYYRKNEQ